MNVKRYLKKQARKDWQAIIEADGGKTLRTLGIDYPAPRQKKRVLPLLLGTAGAAVSIALIACTIAFYSFQSKAEYIDANRENRESALTEMKSEVHDFSFEFDESSFSVQIARTYDSVSNDVLYYTILLNRYDSFVDLELVVVCNPDFEYKDFGFQNPPMSKSLPLYDVLYSFETQPDPQFGLDRLSCTAEIDGESDIVYVKHYEELLVQPEPAFFDIIQTIVKPAK